MFCGVSVKNISKRWDNLRVVLRGEIYIRKIYQVYTNHLEGFFHRMKVTQLNLKVADMFVYLNTLRRLNLHTWFKKRFNGIPPTHILSPMEIYYLSEPKFTKPIMIAAWPGMGYLAKISADYLRRRLKAKLFAEIRYFQNAIIYKDSLAEFPPIKHRFYAVPGKDLLICIGDAQPSTPEEALRVAGMVVDVAERFNVKRVYTMAAYPSDYKEEPNVYGVYTDERLKDELTGHGVSFIEGEGAVNGLNGILIGVAENRGIHGICLMGEIKYANVPQHLSSKAVLEKLAAILDLEIDTTQLEKRAMKIDASIRKSLSDYQEYEEPIKKREEFRYIS